MRAAILSILLLATPATAQNAPVWSPEAVANLRGFALGVCADCAARCDASSGGPECANRCFCLVSEVSPHIDPRTLEADGKSWPSPDDIARFVTDNRTAFQTAIDTCGLPGQ